MHRVFKLNSVLGELYYTVVLLNKHFVHIVTAISYLLHFVLPGIRSGRIAVEINVSEHYKGSG